MTFRHLGFALGFAALFLMGVTAVNAGSRPGPSMLLNPTFTATEH